MLSVVDLIEAGTLNASQAAWLAVRILDGSSFLVGARPGGAGKTTVMGALLGLLPVDTATYLTTPDAAWRESTAGDCIIAYEISAGFYDAYIWGDDVRAMCKQGVNGRRIVSNLHADTIDEARAQIVAGIGATEQEFQAFDLFLPIEVSRGFGTVRRRIDAIYSAENDTWGEACIEIGARERECEAFFQKCRKERIRTIESVRDRWVRFVQKQM